MIIKQPFPPTARVHPVAHPAPPAATSQPFSRPRGRLAGRLPLAARAAHRRPESAQYRGEPLSGPMLCAILSAWLPRIAGNRVGSVTNYRKQERSVSQAIDFLRSDFQIRPRKGNFATEPPIAPSPRGKGTRYTVPPPPTQSRGTGARSAGRPLPTQSQGEGAGGQSMAEDIGLLREGG
jgi:hypothetical protein